VAGDSEEAWCAAWLDAVVAGERTMSQRKLSSVERRGGGLDTLRRLAQARGVHLLILKDEHDVELVAASLQPFRVVC
jgi:hypothetical protein